MNIGGFYSHPESPLGDVSDQNIYQYRIVMFALTLWGKNMGYNQVVFSVSDIEDTTNHARYKQGLEELLKNGYPVLDPSSAYQSPGIIKIVFSEDFIRKAKAFISSYGYTNPSSGVAMQLKSVYALRMYQLLGMMAGESKTFEIEDLKNILGVQGKYDGRPVDFINRIVKHSQNELNSQAEWTFSFSTVKEGKKTTGIILTRIPGQGSGEVPVRSKPVKVSPAVMPDPDRLQIKPVEAPRQEPTPKPRQEQEKSPEEAVKQPQMEKIKSVGFWNSLWEWFRSFFGG